MKLANATKPDSKSGGKRSGGVVHIAALCRRFLEWRRLVSSGVFDHLVFSTSTVAMGSSAFAGN
jgi:hypothetical protein